MTLDDVIKKLTRKSSQKHTISAVVQPDAIYFASAAVPALPERSTLDGHSWQQALCAAVRKAGLKGVTLDVVLHSQLYQSYQIDQPAVPREEWTAALPFLLKDLISEKVTEVVADAHPLTGSNKVQTYVMTKAPILELADSLEKLGCHLGRMVPEQEVWAHCLPEQAHFLLLQRSQGGHFKLDAFVDKQCNFQRTLRGIVAPLTGMASSMLQLDGLALELQRSIDYLSSQLKGIPLHQLHICCDGEDHAELISGLNERLNVKVFTLSDEVPQELSGQLLARHCRHLPDSAVNFYQQQLKPQKDHFTLANVCLAWGGVALIMLAVAVVYHFRLSALDQQVAEAKALAAQRDKQISTLKQQVAQHQPSAEKLAAVARLKKEIDAKQESLAAINQFDHSQQVGYSGVMNALAKLARRDISLRQIDMTPQRFDIEGLARDAEVVPSWIAEFQSELHLTGRSFDRLVIGRNDDDVITFELKTQQGAK
ncbi:MULTISPECIES: PilN domain-containing protein [Gammaproteobacteria]|uniref:MSHA biogenesis protein MshI n=1 Tax=Vibrio ostreae TaxID=2841925 RepID=A0A975YMY6_9VIBR|nr:MULTISPECIES: MSHA biogenesis protein MshI [Vibrio]QXO17119.1 MSHA biogenesis protein MshI [Vibrio ostreae]